MGPPRRARVEAVVVGLREAGALDDPVEGGLEGGPFSGHLSHAGVVDGDRIVERLLGGIDAVGLLPQLRVGGQGDEPGCLDGSTECAEDPLGHEEGVQVFLPQGPLWQLCQAVAHDIGEQTQPAALRAHALHRRPLPLEFGLPRDEGLLQPLEDARDIAAAAG